MGDLLQIAEMASSTFYYQSKAQQKPDKHGETKCLIKSIFDRHKGRYGYRRIAMELRRLGRVVNHKVVQRLMEELGLKSLVRKKRYQSYKGEMGRIAPNVLKRKFNATHPNRKWVTDVTEFKVGNKKVYLSPIMDLFNGEIIAFTTAIRPAFELIGSMVEKALATLQAKEIPMLHSDQGWQYQMPAYQKMLKERGMVQSMSRKGNCHDNAAMESFFGTLKSEYFYLNEFSSVEQLESGLAEYIHYYNHDRIKLDLNGLSPVEYRIRASQA